MSFTYDTIRFIGVGNMGQYMADSLLQKLRSVRLYVHDVSRAPVNTLCSKYPERVVACANAKKVAENSVVSCAAPAARWCPVPGILPEVSSGNGYKGGFKVQLMRKDFGLAVDTAKRLGVRLALGDVGLETYTAAMNDPRCRDLDSSVVYRFLGGNEDWKKDFENVD